MVAVIVEAQFGKVGHVFEILRNSRQAGKDAVFARFDRIPVQNRAEEGHEQREDEKAREEKFGAI